MFFSFLDYLFNVYKIKNFPCPVTLSYSWSIGFVLFFFLMLQYVSGVFLMFFVNFDSYNMLYSKSFVMKEVEGGWFFSYSHLILPSFLFIFLFFHVFKSFFYPITSFMLIWFSGCVLFVLMVFMAFTGYSLVFGWMSYWALVVVQNMLSFLFGDVFSSVLLFDSSVSLTDFMLVKVSLYHYMLSVLVLLFMYIHIWLLHKGGSSGSGFFYGYVDMCSFFLCSLGKDLVFLSVFLFIYLYYLCFNMEVFFSCDNSFPINMELVPEEMTPEWFLSMFFVILKSSDLKGLGMLGMFSVFLFLFYKVFKDGLLNWLNSVSSLSLVNCLVVSFIYFLMIYSVGVVCGFNLNWYSFGFIYIFYFFFELEVLFFELISSNKFGFLGFNNVVKFFFGSFYKLVMSSGANCKPHENMASYFLDSALLSFMVVIFSIELLFFFVFVLIYKFLLLLMLGFFLFLFYFSKMVCESSVYCFSPNIFVFTQYKHVILMFPVYMFFWLTYYMFFYMITHNIYFSWFFVVFWIYFSVLVILNCWYWYNYLEI